MVPTDGQSYTVITFSAETSTQTNGLVQYRERKGGRKGARGERRELMLVRKEMMNVTHHIDVTTFDLRRDEAPNIRTWGHKLGMNHF